MADREKTIDYCDKVIILLDDSKDSIDEKVYYLWVMFYVYLSSRDENNIRLVIDRMSIYSCNEEVKEYVRKMQRILKDEMLIDEGVVYN